MCPIFGNPFLSNPGDPVYFFYFLQFLVSAEPTLVGRVRGIWWMASLGVTVTARCIFFYIKLPETIEVFRYGGESWTEGVKYVGRVVLCPPISVLA